MRCHPGTRFTVGGCGSLHWRKGSDLFLSVAYELVVRRGITDVDFVWLGGDHDSEEAGQRTDDLVRLGLEDQVRFAPPMNDPAGSGWYESLDAFLLTSREDPFPLVIHEAAAAGVPIVGFAGCGGFDEFARDGEGGVLVPFGDCAGMSAVLADWIADRESARRAGEAARARWRQDYDPQVTAARLWAIDVKASMVDARTRAGARASTATGRSVLGRLLQAR
jgi:glycosyltransferase involved in cell wall biosynthesis